VEGLRGWAARRRAPLLLALRITVACIAAYALAKLLGLAQGYWAVLTAVIGMQASVGGSLKASLDRFVGSLGGAAWGVVVGVTIHRDTGLMMGVALAASVGPLAVLAALRPTYRVAPVTAIILLLAPSTQIGGALEVAMSRLLEIGLGSVIALLVALLVAPARAHNLLAEAAGKVMTRMSETPPLFAAALEGRGDPTALLAVHDAVRLAIGRAETVAEEAARERANFLTTAPDPDPLIRTLRRLRADIVMLGRAGASPLPPEAWSPLGGSITGALQAIAVYLRAAGQAIGSGQAAPPLAPVEAALAGYAEATAALRQAGALRALSDEAVGRLYGLSFSFMQFGQNLHDLADRIDELAQPSGRKG
jgi:uncharacterized membrane protein YccC